MAQLSCKNAVLGYDGKAVVENLSFEVSSGDYLCVIGENGAGKSTLMKALLGLKAPLEGKIEYGDGLKKNEIGYLPQQTVVQKDFPASVGEVVISGCLNRCGIRPFYTKADRQRAASSMERLGITKLKKRCYRELSGGQQQRVLLARALCAADKLIVLDEPVSGLDPKATAEMYAIIESLCKNDGMTVIMVSHDLNAAIRYASHILHLSHEPLFFGKKEAYLESDIGKAFTSGIGGDTNE